MQQDSYQQCENAAGDLTGAACYSDADCGAGETCPLSRLMSELSVHDNFDLTIGDSVLAANTCPAPRAGDRLELHGVVTTAAPVDAFDNTSFDTAKTSAAGVGMVEFVDSLGAIPQVGEGSSLPISIFAERTATHDWTLHFGIDAGRTGGTAGDLSILGTIDLTFDATGALASVDGTALTAPGFVNPTIDIVGLADGAADASLEVLFDTAGDDRFFEWTGPLNPWEWLWGSVITAGGVQQLGVCDQTTACEKKWNTATNRWEASAVTVNYLHAALAPLSDWEALVNNMAAWYTLAWAAPAGLPDPVSPPGCADAGNVAFDVAVAGADLVTLIIDRSSSMSADRDNFGDVRTRLDWAKAGARVFADLQAGAGAKVGFISFADTPVTELDLRPIEADATATATDHALTAFKDSVDALESDGLTAIGDTLSVARAQLNAAAAANPALQKAVFLLTDGEQTTGTDDPQVVAEAMRNENIQIFAVPLGELADTEFLSRIADETGGALLESEDGLELPTLYAELYARFRGEAPVLPRTRSAVAGSKFVFAADGISGETGTGAAGGGAAAAPAGLPQFETFAIPVERGAHRLNVVLSTRNDQAGTWNPAFQLLGPTGETVTHASPGVIGDDYYRIVRVSNPAPGNWQLTIAAQTAAAQLSYLLAHVENPKPDCYAGVSPRTVVDGNAPVKITASAFYPGPLGTGVEYTATVRKPFGSVEVVPMTLDAQHNGAVGTFDGFIGRGRYDVDVTCKVTDKARLAPGEHSTPEQLLRDPRPEPFVRHAQTGFYVDSDDLPPLPGGGDGDHDGIPDGIEGLVDTDGDHLPDAYDQDSDGDDVPDSEEGGGEPTRDTDGDGIPDFRDPDSDNDGQVDGADPDSSKGGGAAGSKLHFSLHVGSAHPLGDLDDEADANVYVQGDLGYRLTERVDLVGRLGFAQFTEETATTSDNQYWLHASLDAQVLFPTSTGLKWYLQAGPGWYDPKAGSGDFGINLGLGARLPLPGPFGLELGADYHHLFDDPKTRFVTVQLGVLFR